MNKRLFFILSTGRTGTRFLAKLLNSDPQTLVLHEPLVADFDAFVKAYYTPRAAFNYIKHDRSPYIHLQLARHEFRAYGEVNGVLRRHILALQKQFPWAKYLHLVRDGRDVVRSMFSRHTMTARDPVSSKIKPKFGNSVFENWEKMPRFDRICWYWANENAFLRNHVNYTIQFEQILTDYDYFKREVLDYLGLNVSDHEWAYRIKQKINATEHHKMKRWPFWTPAQKATFNLICGKEQYQNGYSIGN